MTYNNSVKKMKRAKKRHYNDYIVYDIIYVKNYNSRSVEPLGEITPQLNKKNRQK